MSKLSNVARWAALRVDGWANTLTGLGIATRDKSTGAAFYPGFVIPDQTLEALFYGDDIAARIVSALPDEAMRQGVEIESTADAKSEEGDDDDTEDALWDACEALGLDAKIQEAATWGRLFGGAALWIGANDGGAQDEALDEESVRSVDFVHVLDKRELLPLTYYVDPLTPMFGKVETYRASLSSRALGQVGAAVTVVHESRLILFPGAPTSAREKARLSSWDYSVLFSVYEVLRTANTNWQSVANLMTDASQAVYKVKGLIELLAGGQEETMRARMELVEMGRSVSRALILDADGEDFTRQPTSFAGLPDVLDRFMLRVAAAAGIPATVLWGMSPAGMNATGESDTRNWYDKVKAYQEKVLRPRYNRVLRLLATSIGADPAQWEVYFPSLWQPTEKEKADTRLVQAQVDEKYMAAGVLMPEEVALSRFGASGYSLETKIDLDARKIMLESEITKAQDNAGEPDPAPILPPGAQPPALEPPDNTTTEDDTEAA